MLVQIPLYIEQIIKEQAKQQGISAEQLAGQTLTAQFGKETAFDIDRMKQAIKGCETEELALKNGLHLPQAKTSSELLAWLKNNIPQHLDKGQ